VQDGSALPLQLLLAFVGGHSNLAV
jgi:hypothetical protein